MLADCSNGMEPTFALVFEKRVTVGRFFYTNKIFEQVLRENGVYREELLETGKVTYTKHTAFAHNFTYENNNSYFDDIEGQIIDSLSDVASESFVTTIPQKGVKLWKKII